MRGGRGGFTLLELVLAMVILAMVTTICYGAFFVATRSIEKGANAVDTSQRLRVATDVLIRQLKSAVAYPERNEDDEVYPYFRGDGHGMTFVTANPRLGVGLARVRYYASSEAGYMRLMLEEDAHFGPDELGAETDFFDPEVTRAAVLLEGFRDVKFEYLLDDGADTEWREVWSAYEEDSLPAAIRIMVDGLPGLESDVWGQEVPIMVALYGEANAEVDEDDLAGDELNDVDLDEDLDEDDPDLGDE